MSFTRYDNDGLIFHRADALDAAGGLIHGFATRTGGVSEAEFSSLNLGRSRGDKPEFVRENYRRFEAALGGSLNRLVLCRQVHSDRVELVTEADALPDLYAPTPFEADGLITNVPGVALAVFYADCIPVLLYDPVLKVVAALHSGWRGTARGIVGNAVTRMQEHFACAPAQMLAAIGPGICEQCFETHEDVPLAMRELYGQDAEAFITPLPTKKFQVDLKGMIAHTLRKAGLLPQHIDDLSLCTACHPELYWSHRRLGEKRGNQAAIVVLQ